MLQAFAFRLDHRLFTQCLTLCVSDGKPYPSVRDPWLTGVVFVRFEVSTTTLVKILIFWELTFCRWVFPEIGPLQIGTSYLQAY